MSLGSGVVETAGTGSAATEIMRSRGNSGCLSVNFEVQGGGIHERSHHGVVSLVVNSLVKDIFTPILGLIVGGIDFTNIFVTLKGSTEATLADAQKAGAVTLNFGVFLNAVIQSLIVSFAVFWLIKALTRLHIRQDPAPADPPRSEVLLEEIRDLLAAKLS
jgi:large conductance mechanosensitive channel